MVCLQCMYSSSYLFIFYLVSCIYPLLCMLFKHLHLIMSEIYNYQMKFKLNLIPNEKEIY